MVSGLGNVSQKGLVPIFLRNAIVSIGFQGYSECLNNLVGLFEVLGTLGSLLGPFHMWASMVVLSCHGLDRVHRVLRDTLCFMVLLVTHLHVPRLVTLHAGQDQQDRPCEKNHQRFCAQVFQHGSMHLSLWGFLESDDLL